MSLRFAILGLLSVEELSGYAITKRFGESVGYFWSARSQQIYPELARLEEAGAVTSHVVEQVGRPDKRVYSITEEGRRELAEWVVTPSPMTLVKDEFLLKVCCYGLVDPEKARTALTAHREMHEERLANYRAITPAFGPAWESPASLAAEHLGAYLTLSAGIRMEEAFVAWCREAEQVLKERMAEP